MDGRALDLVQREELHLHVGGGELEAALLGQGGLIKTTAKGRSLGVSTAEGEMP